MMEVEIIQEIINKTPVAVANGEDCEGSDTITITFSDGSSIRFFHRQECCETVAVEDVTGDWADLYGHPLLVAEERWQSWDALDEEPLPEWADYGGESSTWTFYTFRNLRGSVDVRWHG